MKLAFALFKYFPFGGVTRDLESLLGQALARGHDVSLYVLRWEGPQLSIPGLKIHRLNTTPGFFRHQSYERFGSQVRRHCGADTMLFGLNKMSDLDVYYAADGCLHQKYPPQSWGRYLNPRTRALLRLERTVFSETGPRLIFMLSKSQQEIYARYYKKCLPRLRVLPPGIRQDCNMPTDVRPFRNRIREELGLKMTDRILLMVGSGFKTKGVDRAIRILGHLSPDQQAQTHLVVLGQDKPDQFIKLSKKMGLIERVHFLGGRADVPDFLFGADILLHPAYHENAGMVILEALIAGLPVGVTRQSGYASFVERYASEGAGFVWDEPLNEKQCAVSIQEHLSAPLDLWPWRGSAEAFAARENLHGLHVQCVKEVEDFFR